MAAEQLSEVLREFARTMVTDFPIQRILDHLVKRIVEILPVTAAGVTLISPGLDPQYIAASDESALRFEKLQTELGEGPCLAAYHTGNAIAVPDLTAEARFPNFCPRAVQAGLLAVFTFPLHHGELRLGALDLYRGTPGPLSPGSMGTAQTLADVAAAYLLNAQARTELQASSDRSREACLHDALTGLPNRDIGAPRARVSTRPPLRQGIGFVLSGSGPLQAGHDRYGHQAGDQLLVAVGERLTGVLRPGDTLARLHGDEFVILCEDLDEAAQIDAIAARVDAAMIAPFHLTGFEVQISASIGIAFTGHGSAAPEQLLHDADRAMYRTKRAERRDNAIP